MRASPSSLTAFFASRPQQFVEIDFYEFRLQNGITLRYTTYPGIINLPGLPPPGGASVIDVQFQQSAAFAFGGAFGVGMVDFSMTFGGAGCAYIAITTTPGNALGHIGIVGITDPASIVGYTSRGGELETPGNLGTFTFLATAIAGGNLPAGGTMRVDFGGAILGRCEFVVYGVSGPSPGPVAFDSDTSLPATGFVSMGPLTGLSGISTASTNPMMISVGSQPFVFPIPGAAAGWARAKTIINNVPGAPDPGVATLLSGTYHAQNGALSSATVTPWAPNWDENLLIIDAFANNAAPPVIAGTTWIGNDVQIASGSGGKSAEYDSPTWSSKLGGTADQMELNVGYFPAPTLAQDGPQSTIGSTPWPVAIRQGFFRGAGFTMFRAYWTSVQSLLNADPPIGFGDDDQFGVPSNGLINLFEGFVSAVSQVDRISAKLNIRDGRMLLDTDYPRDVFQMTCIHTLYDAGCTLSQADFSASTTMGSPTANAFTYTSTQAPQYYQLGKAIYTDPMTGLTVTLQIGDDTGSVITLSSPFPTIPPGGTAVTLVAGCDKTKSTCINKFNNLAHFLGFPYVPPARTTI